MELGPRNSNRDSLPTRGLALGAGLGLGAALHYLTLYAAAVLVVGPIVNGVLTGQPVGMVAPLDVSLIALAAVINLLVIAFVVGVLPATAAGAVAALGIGAMLRMVARRQRSARSSVEDSPFPVEAGPGPVDRRRSDRRAWLIGTAVTCLVGLAVVTAIGTVTQPDLVWSPISLLVVWLPVLIFVLTGGPFAMGLQRAAIRDR